MNKKISRRQWMTLIWAGTLAPAAEWLPGAALDAAGRGAWLSVWLAGILIWAAGRLWAGRTVGRAGALLYGIWGVVLLALRLRMCAQRFYAGGEGRDGVLGFFLLVVAGMVLWMSRGDLPTLGRAGQLFFAALLLGAGTVLVLSLPQLRPERVFPLYLEESGGILWGALPAAGVLGWSFYAAFLQQDVAEQGEDQKRQWRLWSLGGCGLLGLGQLVILGVLGVELARRVQSPFFLLAKGVSIQGGFQRVESIVAALWLFSDLTQAGVLVFALKKLFGRAFGEKWEKVCPWAAVLTALAAAFLPLWDGETLALFGGKLVPAGNLLLGLAVPALESLRRGLHRRRGA